jgi:pimeloyl-ACP methyl ester carboxylesterase
MEHQTVVNSPSKSDAPRKQRMRWWQRVALALAAVFVVLTGGLFYGAYGYQPSEAGRDYKSKYLQDVPSSYVDTSVARFHYVQAGTGSPVILLPPGTAWAIAWQQQLSALAAHHTVYVVDLPGQGYTTMNNADFQWDLAGMAEALGSFMDAVHVDRAAIAGNSWSGGWALDFAQRHPERVTGLILLDSSGLVVEDSWQWKVLEYPVVGEILTNLLTSKSTVRSSLEDSLVHRDLITDELVDETWAPLTFRDNLRSTYQLQRGLDWRETERAMPATQTPTLVLWGREDNVLPVWQAERFGQLLPNVQVNVLDQCGHVLEYDCPDQVTDLMLAFLDGR